MRLLSAAGFLRTTARAPAQRRPDWATRWRGCRSPARSRNSASACVAVTRRNRAVRSDIASRFSAVPAPAKPPRSASGVASEVFVQQQRLRGLEARSRSRQSQRCAGRFLRSSRRHLRAFRAGCADARRRRVPLHRRAGARRGCRAGADRRRAERRLFTTSRVLVINAAYDAALIKRAYRFCRASASCTHVVFTHLDELDAVGQALGVSVERKAHPALSLDRPERRRASWRKTCSRPCSRALCPSTGPQAAKQADRTMKFSSCSAASSAFVLALWRQPACRQRRPPTPCAMARSAAWPGPRSSAPFTPRCVWSIRSQLTERATRHGRAQPPSHGRHRSRPGRQGLPRLPFRGE